MRDFYVGLNWDIYTASSSRPPPSGNGGTLPSPYYDDPDKNYDVNYRRGGDGF